MMSVSQALAGMARQRGSSLATVFGDRERTWEEWLDEIRRLASGLRGRGLETGDRVAILALNSDRYLDALFAVAWAGGIVVPVNTRLSAAEVGHILAHADLMLAFVDAELEDVFAMACATSALRIQVIAMDGGMTGEGVAEIIAAADPVPAVPRADDDVSGIFYTGGTTGLPKGVMLSQASHIVHSLALWSGVVDDLRAIRYLHAAPMFHAADMEFVYGVTVVGGTHYVLPRFDAGDFIAAVKRWGITDAVLVPTMIRMVLDHPDFDPDALGSLRRLWYGGAPIDEATLERLIGALPNCGPVQLYGQTESGPIITRLESRDHDLLGMGRARLRSAGRAIPGSELVIMGTDDVPLPAGEVGEIVVRSGSVMQGYWRDEVQTQAALRGGWLRTGDAGYMDDEGYLFITDRFKDMIIIGGENVYSVEVEQAIYACADVAQCAVIGLPCAQWGERVHAIVVPSPGARIEPYTMQSRLRERLAGYKVPRTIELREAPLPLSGAGKMLKRKLRQDLLDVAQPNL